MILTSPSFPVSVSLYPTCGRAVITHRRYGSNAARFRGFDDLAAPTGTVGDPPDRASPTSSPYRYEDPEANQEDGVLSNLDKRTLLNQDRSARRRRSNILLSAIHLNADHLITLTTRPSANFYTVSDLWRGFHETRRRFSRASFFLPEWVAVPELHHSDITAPSKFNSLHLHLLVHGRVDLDAWRSCWPHGSVNVKDHRRSDSASERLAGYLSSYVSKETSRRALRDLSPGVAPKLWGRSKGAIPPRHTLHQDSLSEALEVIEGTIGPVESVHLPADLDSGRPECWIVTLASDNLVSES